MRGVWRNPDAGIEALRTYAVRWVAERDLSERTRELYRGLLARQIVPFIGGLDLLAITPARVRSWRRDLIGPGVGASTVAKAYRLLRAILNTAADDEVIVRNPCRIKGAGVELTPERPVVGLAEVLALAAAMPPRYRVLVLLAVFGSMRWGELMGLRRPDIDLENASVNIERSVVELGTDRLIKEPRTQAGVRSVALPTWLVPELRHHLDTFAEAGSEGRVFIGSHGATPRRGTSPRSGSGPRRRRGSGCRRISTSMICGTREATSLRRPGRVRGS